MRKLRLKPWHLRPPDGTNLERNDKPVLGPLIHHRFKNLGHLIHLNAQVPLSRLNLVFRHLLSWQEKVADGGGEVIHGVLSENGELVADGAQEPQIVVHGDKGEGVQHARRLDGLVRGEHLEEVPPLLGGDGDLREVVGAVVDLEKVEKGVGRVGVVAAKGLQAELAVHEEDGISGFEKVLCGGGASRSWPA